MSEFKIKKMVVVQDYVDFSRLKDMLSPVAQEVMNLISQQGEQAEEKFMNYIDSEDFASDIPCTTDIEMELIDNYGKVCQSLLPIVIDKEWNKRYEADADKAELESYKDLEYLN